MAGVIVKVFWRGAKESARDQLTSDLRKDVDAGFKEIQSAVQSNHQDVKQDLFYLKNNGLETKRQILQLEERVFELERTRERNH